MGLDQYAIARKGEPTTKEEVFTITDENGDEKEIASYPKPQPKKKKQKIAQKAV